MKNRILTLLLCLLLLLSGLPAHAAGGAEDPLISQSYAEGTFLPQLREALKAAADRFLNAFAAAQPAAQTGWKLVRLAEGDSVALSAGQQLTLLSGKVKLQLQDGTLINATEGRSSTGGDARAAHRYILCGGTATAVAGGDALLTVSAGAKVSAAPTTPGACPFTDLQPTDWYYTDVISAYERGLVNGVTETSYVPQSSLTVAQAIKLAACMHQLYHTGGVTLAPAASAAWYAPYAEYARANDILKALPADYDAAVTRGEFIKLFFNAMPEKEYVKQNLIMDGAIPDVATDAPLAKQVYIFYEAGILTGYPADGNYLDHAFGPETGITRAEVATIMNRMFTPSARIKFTMD